MHVAAMTIRVKHSLLLDTLIAPSSAAERQRLRGEYAVMTSEGKAESWVPNSQSFSWACSSCSVAVVTLESITSEMHALPGNATMHDSDL